MAIAITIYIVIEMKKENEERMKEKRAYNRLETKNDYYEKVEESQNQIRRLYHDMNNHLYNIQMMNIFGGHYDSGHDGSTTSKKAAQTGSP